MPSNEPTKKKTMKKAPAAPKKVAVKKTAAPKKQAPAKPAATKMGEKTTVEAKLPILTKEPARGASVAHKAVKVEVLDTKGKVVESVSLPGTIFGAKVNPALMAQAVRVYLANQRQGTRSTKTRGEVTGSTRKIYRQKGTGRARHGGVRAPIFVHGGVAHGPKPVDFSRKLTQKMRQAALFSALTAKLQDKEVKIVTGLEKLPPKTKEMAAVFKNLALQEKNQKVLLVLSEASDATKSVIRISRNIDGVTYTFAQQLNTYEVLNNRVVVFVPDAVGMLEKHFGRKETH